MACGVQIFTSSCYKSARCFLRCRTLQASKMLLLQLATCFIVAGSVNGRDQRIELSKSDVLPISTPWVRNSTSLAAEIEAAKYTNSSDYEGRKTARNSALVISLTDWAVLAPVGDAFVTILASNATSTNNCSIGNNLRFGSVPAYRSLLGDRFKFETRTGTPSVPTLLVSS